MIVNGGGVECEKSIGGEVNEVDKYREPKEYFIQVFLGIQL